MSCLLKVKKCDVNGENIVFFKELTRPLIMKEFVDFVNEFLDKLYGEMDKKNKNEDYYLKIFDDSSVAYYFVYEKPCEDDSFIRYSDMVEWKDFLQDESLYPSFVPYNTEIEHFILKKYNDGSNVFKLFDGLIKDLKMDIEKDYYSIHKYQRNLMDLKSYNDHLNLMVNNIVRFAQYGYIEEEIDFIKLMKLIKETRNVVNEW